MLYVQRHLWINSSKIYWCLTENIYPYSTATSWKRKSGVFLHSRSVTNILRNYTLSVYWLIYYVNIMTLISTSFEAKLQQAISHLPPSHRTLPQRNETFESLDAARLRLQDYAFTQRFALVTEKNYKKHSTLVLDCSRHHKDTRNYRKLSEEDRIRKNAKVSFNDCKYRLRLQQYKGETGWKFKHHERISRSWYGCWSFYVSQTLISRSRS